MVQTANAIWADGPSASPYEPDKREIRTWGTWVESILNAVGINSGTVFRTRAALFANLALAANTMAWVVNDSTLAYNGIYQKIGATGTGSWLRVADLPYSFVTFVDAGAGTPNALQLTSSARRRAVHCASPMCLKRIPTT